METWSKAVWLYQLWGAAVPFALKTVCFRSSVGEGLGGGKTGEWKASDEAGCPVPAPPQLPLSGAKCTLPFIQVILMEQKAYTSGAALQLRLHCAFLLRFAEPWVKSSSFSLAN